MKRAVGAAVVAAVVAPSFVLHSPAGATCAGPELSVRTTLVEVGEAVKVSGSSFGADCDDTGRSRPAAPASTEISFAQADRSSVLATVTPDRKHRFRSQVTIPRWATPGTAELAAPPAPPVTVTVMSDDDPFVPLPERGRPLDDRPTPQNTTASGQGGADRGDSASVSDGESSEPDEPDERLAVTGPTGPAFTAVIALAFLVTGAGAVCITRR